MSSSLNVKGASRYKNTRIFILEGVFFQVVKGVWGGAKKDVDI
jgi:hypothetical protein